MCPWCVPTAKAGAPGWATGGAEVRLASVPVRLGLRFASPWQLLQAMLFTSALPFMCPLAVALMVPFAFTAAGWQTAQEAAVAGEATARWPAGGIPWHDVQVIGVVSVQSGVALAPETPLKVKLPWQ